MILVRISQFLFLCKASKTTTLIEFGSSDDQRPYQFLIPYLNLRFLTSISPLYLASKGLRRNHCQWSFRRVSFEWGFVMSAWKVPSLPSFHHSRKSCADERLYNPSKSFDTFSLFLPFPFLRLPTLKRHRMGELLETLLKKWKIDTDSSILFLFVTFSLRSVNELLKDQIAELHAFSQKTYTPKVSLRSRRTKLFSCMQLGTDLCLSSFSPRVTFSNTKWVNRLWNPRDLLNWTTEATRTFVLLEISNFDSNLSGPTFSSC